MSPDTTACRSRHSSKRSLCKEGLGTASVLRSISDHRGEMDNAFVPRTKYDRVKFIGRSISEVSRVSFKFYNHRAFINSFRPFEVHRFCSPTRCDLLGAKFHCLQRQIFCRVTCPYDQNSLPFKVPGIFEIMRMNYFTMEIFNSAEARYIWNREYPCSDDDVCESFDNFFVFFSGF